MTVIETLKRFERETKKDLKYYSAIGDTFCADHLKSALEDIETAIKAVEKQIQRKPNLKDVGTDQWIECPFCGDTKIDDGGTDYCSACGQKLDWSEFV